MTNSKKINDICLSIIYIVELIFLFFPVFLTINLILVPFSYLYHFVNIVKFNNTFKAAIKLVLWSVVGLPYALFYGTIVDSILFFRMVFMNIYVKESLEKVDVVSLKRISRFAKLNSNEDKLLDEAITILGFSVKPMSLRELPSLTKKKTV